MFVIPISILYKIGWGDWLGTGNIANQNRIYRPFDEAKNIVHRLKFKSYDKWGNYCKSGKSLKIYPLTLPGI
jgi:hypothetical protein